MSQVGSGDLKPRNDAETGTVFAIELLGVACFGYVVGTVSSWNSPPAPRMAPPSDQGRASLRALESPSLLPEGRSRLWPCRRLRT